MTTPEERLAALEANHTNIKEDITEIKEDIKKVLETINKQKGGVSMLTAVVGLASGGIGAFVAKKIGFS